MAEDRSCLFCGAPDGFYLDATTICVGCARGAEICLEHSPSQTALVIVDAASNRRVLKWTATLSSDLDYWSGEGERFEERRRVIATGSADIDDPAFVVRIEDYFAQTEDYQTLAGVMGRQRARVPRRVY